MKMLRSVEENIHDIIASEGAFYDDTLDFDCVTQLSHELMLPWISATPSVKSSAVPESHETQAASSSRFKNHSNTLLTR